MGEIVAGRVELVDVLGAGGMGTVWRAWDHRQRCYVAAKLLRQADSDSLIRFVREAKRVIDHPAVVAPRSWFAEDDRVLFTMELVRGGSVATLLKDFGTVPEGWAVEIARQAAEILAAVHAIGFAHRDVKPGNLLLDHTGRGRPSVRLSDFGNAVAFDEPRLTVAGMVIGTPGYLPPEVMWSASPAPTQDVYALGVLLRQLLTGEAPPDPWLATADPGPRSPPLCEPGLAALVEAMTAESPTTRPQSMTEVAERLSRLPAAADLARGADPDHAIEVFDQVPPLPEGWSARGPDQRSHPGPTARRRPAPSDTPRREDHPASVRPAPGPSATPRGGRWRDPWPLALLGLGLVLIAAAILLA